MMTKRQSLVLASLALAMSAGRSVADWEPAWMPGDGVPGVDGLVSVTIPWDPDGAGEQASLIIVAGHFSLAGSVSASNIALWNPITQTWSTLGSGLNGWVSTVAVLNGKLYAGGYFTTAGGATANGIACWDPVTQTWSALSGALSTGTSAVPAVTGLAGLNGKLYVAGKFTSAGSVAANNIVCWNTATSTWSSLGTGLSNTAFPFAYVLTGLNGKLYVGGDFATAGGLAANRIACWDPATSAWSTLGTGVAGVEYPTVHALAGLADKLYVAGDFATAGGLSSKHIAAWDVAAQTWSSVGAETIPIRALAVGGDRIYALHVACQGDIGSWDSTTLTWSNLVPAPADATAYHAGALAVLDGKLFVGGDFNSAAGLAVQGIAALDLAMMTWSALGSGINGPGLAMAALNSKVFVGGDFSTVGGVAASKIACLDPSTSSWAALGPGLDDPVLSVTTLDDKLYAGGQFSHAGVVPVNHIACWDPVPSIWSALGTGIGGPYPEVSALAVLNGKLYAGGSFANAGGVPANNIARWDPVTSTWSAMGLGMDDRVNALVVLNGKLYAGGYFTTVDGLSAKGIACWDPMTQAWSALGAGISTGDIYTLPFVRALSNLDGKLYVAGFFNTAGAVNANRVACWDPTAAIWSALGTGLNEDVYALAGLNGRLFVGGLFETAGGVNAGSIAKWDPTVQIWSAFGTGMDESVQSLAALEGTLYAGGSFAIADGQISSYLARTERFCSTPSADLDHDCDVDNFDFSIFAACARGAFVPYGPPALSAGCTLQPDNQGFIAADFDHDGDVDQDDFGRFQRCYSGNENPADPACVN